MNEERTDGGPAFPVDQLVPASRRSATLTGMSLRDYFAARALQGLIAVKGGLSGEKAAERRSEQAYRFADAMLEAREK